MAADLSLRSLFAYAGSFLSQLTGGPSHVGHFYEPSSGAPACPIDGPLSCHNSTPIIGDACCFVHPGGRILLTQFWDQHSHALGAETDWTLHGLWPDLCDGTYDQFCHMTPHFNNITDILKYHGQHELIQFMNRYWLASDGRHSRLWEHEYNKHATCINTLAPSCYGEAHQSGIEVVDYFSRASALFRTLDTYHALESAGIVPDPHRHYPLADIQAALQRYSGSRVVLRCEGRRGRSDILHEAWYVYFVKGSLQTGVFVPAKELSKEGDAGNCAPWVRYLPKNRAGMVEDDL